MSLRSDSSKGLSTQVLIPMAGHMITGSGVTCDPSTWEAEVRQVSEFKTICLKTKPTTITDRTLQILIKLFFRYADGIQETGTLLCFSLSSNENTLSSRST